MTSKEAFAAGILAEFQRRGVNTDEAIELLRAGRTMDKTALLGELGQAASGVVKPLMEHGLPLAIVAPPAIGGLLGYALARGSDIDDTDVAEMRDRELMDTLENETNNLKRQEALRKWKGSPRSARPAL